MNKLLIILLLPSLMFAQKWGNQEGELEDARVIIEKETELSLSTQPRSFDKIPPLYYDQAKRELSYTFTGDLPMVNIELPRARVFATRQEPLDRLFGNSLTFGAGNYGNTFFNGSFSNKRDHRYATGLHVLHRGFRSGVVDGRNSGFNYQRVSPYAEFFGRKSTMRIQADYQRNLDRAYGYDTTQLLPEFSDLSFSTHRFNTDIRFSNLEKRYVDVTGDLGFFYFSNSAALQNIGGKVGFEMTTNQKDGIGFYTEINGFIDQIGDSLMTNSRVLTSAAAGVNYHYSNAYGVSKAYAGLRFTYLSDSLNNTQPLGFYPDLGVNYLINENFSAAMHVDGDIYFTGLNELTQINRLLEVGNAYFHEINPLGIDITGTARLAEKISATAGYRLDLLQNTAFLVKNQVDSSFFNLSYDTSRFNRNKLWIELQSQPVAELKIMARFEQYFYNMSTLEAPWHMPLSRFDARAQYSFNNKWLTQVSFLALAGIQAPGAAGNAVNLDPLLQLNAQVTYQINDRFSAYVMGQNLLNQENMWFFGYPQPGVSFNAGLSYIF